MCAYRSLFSFIDFKMLQKSLKEISKMDYDVKAATEEERNLAEQIDLNINDYRDVFAADFCSNLRSDLES